MRAGRSIRESPKPHAEGYWAETRKESEEN